MTFTDRLYAQWRAFWPQTNLLLPDLKAEIVVTIDWEGQSRVFFTKIDNQADIAQIATAVIQAGIQLAEQRGLKLKLTPRGQEAMMQPGDEPIGEPIARG